MSSERSAKLGLTFDSKSINCPPTEFELKKTGNEKEKNYAYIYKKYHLTPELLKQNLDYYNSNPDKMIAIYAKMARGMMSNFIIKNKLSNPDEIKLFDTEGYSYNDQLSEGDKWVFTR